MIPCMRERQDARQRGERWEEEQGGDLVMAATAIGEDLDAAECQEDVRGGRGEQLLTRLWCQSQIPSANQRSGIQIQPDQRIWALCVVGEYL